MRKHHRSACIWSIYFIVGCNIQRYCLYLYNFLSYGYCSGSTIKSRVPTGRVQFILWTCFTHAITSWVTVVKCFCLWWPRLYTKFHNQNPLTFTSIVTSANVYIIRRCGINTISNMKGVTSWTTGSADLTRAREPTSNLLTYPITFQFHFDVWAQYIWLISSLSS